MKRILTTIMMTCILVIGAEGQTKADKVYNEDIDPANQVKEALEKAGREDKFVVCQIGGNWCRWCLLFSDYISKDKEIMDVIDENYVYIHVNYNPRERNDKEKMRKTDELMRRLGNPARFGFPVFVILDAEGKVIHIQDSSFLEEGNGYNKEKVMRFFKNWTPESVII